MRRHGMTTRSRFCGVLGAAAMCLLAQGCAGRGETREEPAATARAEGWQVIGMSVKGRPIEAITVGQGARKVLVIGGIHGDEREAQPSISRLVARLGTGDAAQAATWCVVRDLNPDGTALARRPNARQVDLNRNFPAKNYVRRDRHGPKPLSEPETAALVELVAAQPPQLVVVFHSSAHGPFVNFDGPAGEEARAFASGAASGDPRWRLVPDMSYSTPGSLGSYFGVDEGIPVLTVEFERGQEALGSWLAIASGFEGLVAYLAEEAGAPASAAAGQGEDASATTSP